MRAKVLSISLTNSGQHMELGEIDCASLVLNGSKARLVRSEGCQLMALLGCEYETRQFGLRLRDGSMDLLGCQFIAAAEFVEFSHRFMRLSVGV